MGVAVTQKVRGCGSCYVVGVAVVGVSCPLWTRWLSVGGPVSTTRTILKMVSYLSNE